MEEAQVGQSQWPPPTQDSCSAVLFVLLLVLCPDTSLWVCISSSLKLLHCSCSSVHVYMQQLWVHFMGESQDWCVGRAAQFLSQPGNSPSALYASDSRSIFYCKDLALFAELELLDAYMGSLKSTQKMHIEGKDYARLFSAKINFSFNIPTLFEVLTCSHIKHTYTCREKHQLFLLLRVCIRVVLAKKLSHSRDRQCEVSSLEIISSPWSGMSGV